MTDERDPDFAYGRTECTSYCGRLSDCVWCGACFSHCRCHEDDDREDVYDDDQAALFETRPGPDPHQRTKESLLRWRRGEFEIVRDPMGRVA